MLTVSGAHASRIFDVNPVTSGSVVDIESLTLANGIATGNGGAIRNQDAALKVFDSVLTGNTAGKGGAIYEAGDYPSAKNTRVGFSTLRENVANDDGGAIYGRYATGSVYSSTLSGNHAGHYGGAVWGGYSYPSYFSNSTIAGNSGGYVGGIYTSNPLNRDYLYNTIVGDNHNTLVADNVIPPDVAGGGFYAESSLIETPGTATITQVGSVPNLIGVDPQLRPLALNGGDMPTMKPAATSPVVDIGLSGNGNDQRGFSRPVDNPNVANGPGGDGGDIGAVELTLGEGPQAAVTPTPEPTPLPTPEPTPLPAPHKCKKKKKHHAASSAKKKHCKKKKR